MKIAVFGGSGRVGQALLPALLDRGHELMALRHVSPLSVSLEKVVQGDITDASAVRETMDGAQLVLHMTKSGDTVDQAVDTSVRGTLNVLDAFRDSASAERYVLTSGDAATGIWFHPHPDPISHETPLASYPGYYSLGKVLEETIVAEYHRNYSLPYTIVRLSYMQDQDRLLKALIAGYGNAPHQSRPFSEGYTPEHVQRLDAGGRFIVKPCDTSGAPLGRTLIQWQDVVSGLVATVEKEIARGRLLHLSGPAFLYDVPCQHLADKLGLSVENITVPDAYSFDIDTALTRQVLNWTPKYDVIGMLDAALDWSARHAPESLA